MKTGTDKPHWQGHRERLRGKLLSRGAAALDDYEIHDGMNLELYFN